MPKDMVMP